MKRLFISEFIPAIILLCSCTGSRHTISQGEIIDRVSTFGTFENNLDSSFVISEKAWYQDSIGIAQICGFFTEGTDDVQTTTIKTFGYRFVDIRIQNTYRYCCDLEKISVHRYYIDSRGGNFANKKSVGLQILRFYRIQLSNTLHINTAKCTVGIMELYLNK